MSARITLAQKAVCRSVFLTKLPCCKKYTPTVCFFGDLAHLEILYLILCNTNLVLWVMIRSKIGML